ncbi:MAG: hypothetical protein JWL70_2425 [Acidimicrobiia bacterium]|nr:hypothetical protein [Acidimicrobiia bacterium]
MVVLAVLGLVQQLRIRAQLTGKYVSEDQALMWAAARAWGHGQPHDPSFWGQRYGVTLEAIPAEVLRWLGLHLDVGFPLVLVLMGLGGWWLMAGAAWWRGHQALAVALVAGPLLLRADYSVVVATYASGLGRLLAASCVAAAIAWPRRRVAWTLSLALGGLAVLFDQSTAIVVVPLAFWLLTLLWGRWKDLGIGALGALAPLAWLLVTRQSQNAHPDRDLHPPPLFRPSWTILHDNLAHLDRQIALVAPQLAPTGWLVLLTVALALVSLLLLRAYWAAAALAGGIVITAVVLSLPKSLDGMPSIYFQAGRVVLCLPLLLVLAAVMVVEHGLRPRWPVLEVVAGVAVVSALAQLFTLAPHLSHLETEASATKSYPLTPISAMGARCRDVVRVARETETRWAVFTADRTQAYACAAEGDGVLDTLFPLYERRSWLLDAAARDPATGLVLWGVKTDICSAWVTLVTECRPVAADALLLRFSNRPPLDLVHALGLAIRPFGPGCHPREPATCTWFKARFG